MATKNNAVAWNPVEPMSFTTANEDSNLYTFDMRRLDRAVAAHTGHLGAVLDVHYSPTGREFVSGGYDRTVRIFPVRAQASQSREVYAAKRMQRVFAVRFSLDARFLVTGSDDTNIRVWKAVAARPLGVLGPRERRALDYNERLVRRYAGVDEVRRIARARYLPKVLHKMKVQRAEAEQRERAKRERVRRHHAGDPRGGEDAVEEERVDAEEERVVRVDAEQRFQGAAKKRVVSVPAGAPSDERKRAAAAVGRDPASDYKAKNIFRVVE